MSLFRAGPFAVSTDRFTLSRDGSEVEIPSIPLEILILLLRQDGGLVTRKEIATAIWPEIDPADVTNRINTAINRIRTTLDDDPTEPVYIRTVIGKGYRFVAPVTQEEEAPGPIAASGSEAAAPEQPAALAPDVSISTEPAPALAASLPGTHSLLRTSQTFGDRKLWLAAGVMCAVLFSLFFLWQRNRQTELPPRLYGLVQLTANDTNNPVTAAAPSPDGEQIAYADDDGIMLRARKAGPAHALRSPELYMVTRVAWFPDSLHLAVSGQDPKTHRPTVWSVSVVGDVPALLRTDGANAIPSPDGKRIAFEANQGKEVWVSAPNGDGARRMLASDPGKSLSLLLWSKDGAELYLSSHDADHTSSYAGAPDKVQSPGEFLAVDANSAKITARKSGVVSDQACLLPGNGLLFSGSAGRGRVITTTLWEVTLDPRTGAFRTSPRLVQTSARAIITLNSARQGSLIDAVLSGSQADIYVATLDQNHAGLHDLRRLTYDVGSSYPHSWTPDSRSVIFESLHTDMNQLYRQALDSRNPTQLVSTPYDSALPRITPDGRWIFFLGGEGHLHNKLFRMNSEGGVPVQVALKRGIGEFRCPLLHGGCVLRQVVDDKVVFSRLDPTAGEGRPFYSQAKTTDGSNAFAVSPDGTKLALIRTGGTSSHISVMSFDSTDKLVSSAEVLAAGPVEALQWSADGKGWFAEVFSPNRTSLLAHSLCFIDQSGKEKLLTQSGGGIFGIPSPDGKKLAIVEATRDSNIWSLTANDVPARSPSGS